MEISRRYVEQLQTTVETMRRRGIAVYDFAIKLVLRFVQLAERVREVGEPAAYDLCDYVVNACNEQNNLDAQDRETRNNLVELYLGISVLLVGLSSGQLSGTFVLSFLLGKIFDGWVAAALVLLLPFYVYLSFRKNAALDETERRVWMFGLCLTLGSLLGHLVGERLVRVIPAVFFIQPMIFAFLTDYELSPSSLYSNRLRLLGTAAALSGGLALVSASFPLGSLNLAIVLVLILHNCVLFVHFQVVIFAMKNKTYGASEAQLAYVLLLLSAQFLVALFF